MGRFSILVVAGLVAACASTRPPPRYPPLRACALVLRMSDQGRVEVAASGAAQLGDGVARQASAGGWLRYQAGEHTALGVTARGYRAPGALAAPGLMAADARRRGAAHLFVDREIAIGKLRGLAIPIAWLHVDVRAGAGITALTGGGREGRLAPSGLAGLAIRIAPLDWMSVWLVVDGSAARDRPSGWLARGTTATPGGAWDLAVEAQLAVGVWLGERHHRCDLRC